MNATNPHHLAQYRTALRSLSLRLLAQRSELATCTTIAQIRCVEEAIADTIRQLREAGGVA